MAGAAVVGHQQNADAGSGVSGTLAGTVAPTGSISAVHGVSATLAGTVTPTGAFSGTQGFTGTLAGTISPTGSFAAAHGVAGTLAGTISPTGSIAAAHGVSGTLAGTISPTGSISANFGATRTCLNATWGEDVASDGTTGELDGGDLAGKFSTRTWRWVQKFNVSALTGTVTKVELVVNVTDVLSTSAGTDIGPYGTAGTDNSQTDSAATRYSRCANSGQYAAATTALQTTGVKTIDLGSQAVTDVAAAISGGIFSVSARFSNEAAAAPQGSSIEEYSGGSNPPELCVTTTGGTTTGTLAGTIAPTGSFTAAHGVSATLAGTVAPTGAFSGNQGFTGTLAGTVTPTGAFAAVHGVSATLAGTVLKSGAFTAAHGVSATAAGSIAPTGAFSGTFATSVTGTLAGTIAPTGAIAAIFGTASSSARITVHGGSSGTPIPGIWRPSVMVHSSTPPLIATFNAIAGPQGLVRLVGPFSSTDYHQATSLADFQTRLRAYCSQAEVQTSVRRGTAVFLLNGTPRFLSASSDTSTVPGTGVARYQTARPADLSVGGAFQTAMQAMAAVVMGEFSFPAPRHPTTGVVEIGRPGVLFEWGNEVEPGPGFWNDAATGTNGTHYFSAYSRIRAGGRAANSTFAMAAPSPLDWNSVESGQTDTHMKRFCDYAASQNEPPDCIVHHNFQNVEPVPTHNVTAAIAHIRSSLSNVGLNPDTPVIVTEFQNNQGVSGVRDDQRSAAYLLSTIYEHRKAGFSGIAMASLIKQGLSANPNLFGDFWGMITFGDVPSVNCPNFMAMSLFSLWATGREIPHTAIGADSLGVRRFATKTRNALTVALARWDPGQSSAPVTIVPQDPSRRIAYADVYRFDASTNNPKAVFDATAGSYATKAAAALAAGSAATSQRFGSGPVTLTMTAQEAAIVRWVYEPVGKRYADDEAAPEPETEPEKPRRRRARPKLRIVQPETVVGSMRGTVRIGGSATAAHSPRPIIGAIAGGIEVSGSAQALHIPPDVLAQIQREDALLLTIL